MKTLIIIFFLLFSILLYSISNSYLILILFFLTFLLNIILKNSFKGFKSILTFVLLTIIFNLFFNSPLISFLIGIRLFIIYFLTLIMNKYFSCKDLAKGFSNLFFFSKNKKDLELIIAISISLIPIMINEISTIKKVLISKNFKLSLKNIIKKPNVFFMTYLNNTFKRINELELILKSKGY